MEDFKRVELPDGGRVLEGEHVSVLVEPDVQVKILCRVGIKMTIGGEKKDSVRVGVIELQDRTRIYVSGGNLVITKQDLNP